MKEAELVAEVLAEVQKRLACPTQKQRVVIGGAYSGYVPFYDGISAEMAQEALIVQLPIGSMANLALGAAHTPEESFLLQMLLTAKPVKWLKSGLLYQQYRETAAKTLWQKYFLYEDNLRQAGIIFVDDTVKQLKASIGEQKRSLITEAAAKEIISAGLKEIHLPQKTLLTPLAADLLNNSAVTVVWEG